MEKKLEKIALSNKPKYLVRDFCVHLCLCTESILALQHWIEYFITANSTEVPSKLAFGWEGGLINREKQRLEFEKKMKLELIELNKKNGEDNFFFECVRCFGVDYTINIFYF